MENNNNNSEDCFGTIPSPMTGGGTDWSQFQSNFSKEIAEFVVKLKLTKKDGFAGSSKKISSIIYQYLISLEKEEKEKHEKDPSYVQKSIKILHDGRKRAEIWKQENKDMGEKRRDDVKKKLQNLKEDLFNSEITFQQKKEKYQKQATDFNKAEENKKLAEELILIEIKNEQLNQSYKIMLEEFNSLFPEDASSFKVKMKEKKRKSSEKSNEKKEEIEKKSKTETEKQKWQRLCKEEGLKDVGTIEQLKENYWKHMCRKRNLSDVGNAEDCELRFKKSK